MIAKEVINMGKRKYSITLADVPAEILEQLSSELGHTKTAVITQALIEYWRNEKERGRVLKNK